MAATGKIGKRCGILAGQLGKTVAERVSNTRRPADIEAGPPRRVIDETVARRTALGGRYIPPWQKLHIITF